MDHLERDIEAEKIELLNRVIALCDSFTRDNKPLLLSALGKLLGDDLKKIKSLTGGSLSDLFTTNLSDKYDLVQIGVHRNISAIVPKADLDTDVPIPSRIPPIFETGEKTTSRDRFNRRFWAAFAVPPQSETRYIDIFSFLFRDVLKVERMVSTEVEIPIELIPAAEETNRDEKINASIEKWLERNHFLRSRFLHNPETTKHNTRSHVEQRSVLDLLISSLDRRQLNSISLSLDVVEALLRKKI